LGQAYKPANHLGKAVLAGGIGIRKAIKRHLEANLRKYKEGIGINAKTGE
jgi:hypothetical protein